MREGREEGGGNFLLSWSCSLVFMFPFLGEVKAFSDNSNLTNLVKVQRLHQHGKLIICVSNVVQALFKTTFLLLFHNV